MAKRWRGLRRPRPARQPPAANAGSVDTAEWILLNAGFGGLPFFGCLVYVAAAVVVVRSAYRFALGVLARRRTRS